MTRPAAFKAEVATVSGRAIARFVRQQGWHKPGAIPDDMTFRQWCGRLEEQGLRVDNKPFTLRDRPAMHFIYDLIPTTREQARGNTVVMMKCAQVGFTVLEMLAVIYWTLKFAPITTGMYVPRQVLAQSKSTVRFMPILRAVPEAYASLRETAALSGSKAGGSEGNVMIRQFGGSMVLFLWTTGKLATESWPCDCLSYDEVQQITSEQMEVTAERMSASDIKFRLMGSTAKFPDRDIHAQFKLGTQHRFHTRCEACGESAILDDFFPAAADRRCCIEWRPELRDWRYVCVHCGELLPDTQNGEWIATNPGAIGPDGRGVTSVHFTQMLSPTITAREMMEAYNNATNLENFWNRKLGKPFLDPSRIPVTLEHLRACAAAGEALGVTWKAAGRETYMGVDVMGGYACAVIVERLPTGHMALVHAEQVHSQLRPDHDQWQRLHELMRQYRVQVCVTEQLPNYDSAHAFSQAFPGHVFLVASYSDIDDDMMRWGDATVSKADRKTDAGARDRYTVTIDRYKMMSWALARITSCTFVTPDPNGRIQTILDKGERREVRILSDVLWEHFTHVALVTEVDEHEHEMSRAVHKVGFDPHFSFALMMCCAAWCRNNAKTGFLMPPTGPELTEGAAAVAASMPGLPTAIVETIATPPPGSCGTCWSYEDGFCRWQKLRVREADPGCPDYEKGS